MVSQLNKLRTELTALTRKVSAFQAKHKPVKSRWWIGNDTSTDQLMEVIAMIITGPRHCARTLTELHELTGAARPRISGAIVRLQFTRPVQNLGTKYRAVWWIPVRKR